MKDFLLYLRRDDGISLQAQLRDQLVEAILDGRFAPGDDLPSSRELARQLSIARNTVILAYQRLVDEGYVEPRQRRGYFVAAEPTAPRMGGRTPAHEGTTVAWGDRLVERPSAMRNIAKPREWWTYPYPFVYGQRDPGLFPMSSWRDCTRGSLSPRAVEAWSADEIDSDDPLLIEQIRRRVLPRRGVRAGNDEILVTLGAQHAIYLVARLLSGPGRVVGIEDPCYVDARNIFAMTGATLRPLPVDERGLVVDDGLAGCQLAHITPSHQSPTTVTMPLERRLALLERAARHDLILVEDDYESEANYLAHPTPPLKSIDGAGRVIYIGSLSKLIAPGLRIGYLVAPAPLIAEARALRRLEIRHPPANNQRTVALFLGSGHYDAMMRRLHATYRERWRVMGEALARWLPESSIPPAFGGSSYWVEGPPELDAGRLAERALARGVVIEPGEVHFCRPDPPRRFFRLGFSAIAAARIEPGIRILAELIREG